MLHDVQKMVLTSSGETIKCVLNSVSDSVHLWKVTEVFLIIYDSP